MFGKERKSTDNLSSQPELPDWQKDIECAHMFLLQDQDRLLDTEPGSFEEEGLALRISKRVGNFTQEIRGSYKKALYEPRFGFPDYLEVNRNGNIIIIYNTRDNQLRAGEIIKGRFLESIDFSKGRIIPPEEWGKDQIFVPRIKMGLVGLLKHSLQDRLSLMNLLPNR
jgi:hypothetical protein